jgi:hypothetical protein
MPAPDRRVTQARAAAEVARQRAIQREAEANARRYARAGQLSWGWLLVLGGGLYLAGALGVHPAPASQASSGMGGTSG